MAQQPDKHSMDVRGGPDAESEVIVQVMAGDMVIRMRGRALAVVLLAALNQEELNRAHENGSVHFDYTPKGVTLKPMPTVDHMSFAQPSATIERFKARRR